MIKICNSFGLCCKIVHFDNHVFKIEEKINPIIIEKIFLNYSIVRQINFKGKSDELYLRESIINFYKNKDKLFNDKNIKEV